VVDNHVVTLRKKIEPDPSKPRHIISVRGLGYRFDG
jgi:two-component system response regulator RegX3